MITTEKVTLTLPTDLMAAVRSMAPARRQSQFIAEALRSFIAEQQRKTLRERLIAGYQANASLDVAVAAEWADVEDETWQTIAPQAEKEATDGTTNPTR
jgi:metal-responsive CopG/Arc/MetJ family transcriptional regulator